MEELPGGAAGSGARLSLVGREAELDQISRLVTAGRTSSRALLLLGEAGTGKTSLLSAAVEVARGLGTDVLISEGCEGETDQSFAALHQLLLSLRADLAGLPPHLREALETAFGVIPATRPTDSMLLRIAVLTLLADVSRRRPLLLIVDDVQFFDRDSLDVLSFVMRRLAAEPVTVLLAARGLTPPEGIVTGLPVLVLGPLDSGAAARLLEVQPQAPTGRARLDVLEQAAGNPLAIIELSRAFRGGTAYGLPGSGLSQTLRIQEMFAAQLRSLPAATQRLVLYAAAASDHTELGIIMKAAGAGADLDLWAPAEDAGLIALAGDRVAFRHPLVRTASYQGAPMHQRQQAHTDLAAALADQPALRAWHLAAAAVGPDESVAAALEESAEAVELRSGFFAAARALERAAEVSPSEADRARRYAKAVRAASNAGDTSWVRELYAKVAALTQDADVLGVAASGASMALCLYGNQREAFHVLSSALESEPPPAPRTALVLASILPAVAIHSGLPEVRLFMAAVEGGLEIVDDSDSPFPELARIETCDALRAVVRASADPVAEAALLLQRTRQADAVDAAAGITDITRLSAIAGIAWLADESDVCVESFRRTYAMLRAYGSIALAATTLAPMTTALIDTGRWSEADEQLAEISTLAVVHNMRALETEATALRVTLQALRGRSADGAAATDLNWNRVDLEENRATQVWLLRAAATAATAAGDFEGAYRHLRQLFDDDSAPLHYFLSPRSVADLATAAHRTGRHQDVAPIVAAVREAVGPDPTTRMTLLLHHAEALVGEAKNTEQHFRLAVVNPAAEQWPLARAQARLHYAQWLRRRRRPLDARALLAAALETFNRLGADGLADEARAELRASGVAMASDTPDPLSALTAQEQQIVRMAARGLSNREIGEQLLLSPRTIGSHLYRVYPKLGVSSRHQLRDFFDDL
ncbi:AAA family ATPase [Catenulispora sp. GP43]|uniref:AAA family ATPase n=1 Tax=Catenulispora sp. GP43 TaxID=3156263 RepID=UPI0035114655